ncbi:RidA family protein [Streptomyces sp. C]|uniref:RidA family protein n=1 Tax=unclassified Streptomyces TaxID=2593676 RepID=UPI0001B572D9|nr:RidA family protein [Streptomyces sp. C]EFL19293.1 pyrimidine utilization protein C [Streptomyces sp. C]
MTKSRRRFGIGAVVAAVVATTITFTGPQGASAQDQARRGWDHFTFGVPWEESYGYSQGIRAGDEIYISGQVSHDAAGNFVGAGDFEKQVRTSFDNLDKVLAHYKVPRSQIISIKIFTKDLRQNFDTAARLHKEYVGKHRTTDTIVGVSELSVPEQLVEIEAIVKVSPRS